MSQEKQVQRFETKLSGEATGPTGIVIPPEVIEALGAGKRPAVRLTVNGYAYSSTVGVMGGECMAPFSSEHRKASGIGAGDRIAVTIEVDDKPREVDVPEVLSSALASQGLLERFSKLAPSRRKEYVRRVNDAKAEDTRNRRIEQILSELA